VTPLGLATKLDVDSDTSFVVDFVHRMIFNEPGNFGPCAVRGFLNPYGILTAGIVWHDWSPHFGTAEISAAGIGNWLTRDRLHNAMHLPFERLGCHMVIAHTPAKNDRVVRLLDKLPVTKYQIKNGAGEGLDMIKFTLTREDWVSSRFMR
jgi:RimJ/RimL family protein N-acetyltransferase